MDYFKGIYKADQKLLEEVRSVLFSFSKVSGFDGLLALFSKKA